MAIASQALGATSTSRSPSSARYSPSTATSSPSGPKRWCSEYNGSPLSGRSCGILGGDPCPSSGPGAPSSGRRQRRLTRLGHPSRWPLWMSWKNCHITLRPCSPNPPVCHHSAGEATRFACFRVHHPLSFAPISMRITKNRSLNTNVAPCFTKGSSARARWRLPPLSSSSRKPIAHGVSASTTMP
jgi:hypothetical protein